MKTTSIKNVTDEWNKVNDALAKYNSRGRFYLDSHFKSFASSLGAYVVSDGFSIKQLQTPMACYKISNCSTDYYKLSEYVGLVINAKIGVGSCLCYVNLPHGANVGDRVVHYFRSIKAVYVGDTKVNFRQHYQYPGVVNWEYDLNTDIVVKERTLPTTGPFRLSRETGRSIVDANLGVYDTWNEAYAAAQELIKEMDENLRHHQRNRNIHTGLRHQVDEDQTLTGEVCEMEFKTFYFEDCFEEIVIRRCD